MTTALMCILHADTHTPNIQLDAPRDPSTLTYTPTHKQTTHTLRSLPLPHTHTHTHTHSPTFFLSHTLTHTHTHTHTHTTDTHTDIPPPPPTPPHARHNQYPLTR